MAQSHSRNSSMGTPAAAKSPQSRMGTPAAAKSPQSSIRSSRNESIGQAIEGLSLSSQPSPTILAKRPQSGFGKSGQSVMAQVNFYSIKTPNMPTVHDYTITVKSKDRKDDQIKSSTRQRVIFLLLQQPAFKSAASDYKNRLVSTSELSTEHTTYIDYYDLVEAEARSGKYKLEFWVSLQKTGELNMNELNKYFANPTTNVNVEKYISAMNIFLGRMPGQNRDIARTGKGARFFDVSQKDGYTKTDLEYGLKAFAGYFRAATPTIDGLKLNINTTVTTMVEEGALPNVMNNILKHHDQSNVEATLRMLEQALRRVCVVHKYFGRPTKKFFFDMPRPRINGRLVLPTADKVHFTRDKDPLTGAPENITISVKRHFEQAYPNVVRQNENALVVNLGDTARPNWVPSDLLTVTTGNFYRGLLPQPKQSAKMITFACRPPGKNQDMIQNTGLKQIGVGVSKGLRERFGIEVDNEMTTVTARMLPAPSTTHLVGGKDVTEAGQWNLDGVKFKRPCPYVSMSVLSFYASGRKPTNLDEFKAMVESEVAKHCSLNTKFVEINGFSHIRQMPETLTAKYMREIWQTMKNKKVNIVFVILPDKSADNYATIKLSADVSEGIHTICTVIKDKNTTYVRGKQVIEWKPCIKASVGEVANLVLKLNQKLGGINLSLNVDEKNVLARLSKRRLMIVGADVGHPSPGSLPGAPSIACVVATTEPSCFQYAGSVRLQIPDEHKKSVEFILDFKGMMVERLQLCRKRTGGLPDTIFIYRDGVADGMFGEALRGELLQAKQACREMYGQAAALPQFVYIVAQKRHHTRFYKPKGDKSKNFDRNGNPCPGFIVDNQITDARLWDWYGISHKCLQGTSRPCHYTVLHDETNSSADELQALTHAHCWLFGRTNSSISIHPAARYADLLCDRARVYLRDVYVAKGNQTPYVEANHWLGQFHANVRDTMFFT